MKKIMFNDKFGLTQAVLEGRKTMTRRIVSPANDKQISLGQIDKDWYEDEDGNIYIPSYKVGEIIAIAQSYKVLGYDPDSLDRDPKDLGIRGFMKDSAGWNNKMFVCAAGCKHHILITDIKVERLRDISVEDCLKEGISRNCDAPVSEFAHLINKVSRKRIWERNPFVLVYEFELVK